MKKLILAAVLALSGCVTGNDEAYMALDNMGFTNIHTGDFSMFGCGEHDKYGREFHATNANGKHVSGVVCCGVLKSCTVRF